MMQFTGKAKSYFYDPVTKQATVIFTVNEDKRYEYQQIKDIEKLSIEAKQYRDKRSKDSNSYAWSLIGKLADVLRTSKDEMYLLMLKRYGQSAMVPIDPEILELVKKSVKYWDERGKAPDGKINLIVYKGSSEFDTREMAILIDGIVSECEQMGIETMTTEEIAIMNSRWKSEA